MVRLCGGPDFQENAFCGANLSIPWNMAGRFCTIGPLLVISTRVAQISAIFLARGDAMPQVDNLGELIGSMGAEADESLRQGLRDLAADMAEGGIDRHEPVREIFGLLGDRWSTLILLVLATGRYRHAALRRTINFLGQEENISQRMLTLKLRALERNGLIDRRTSADIPPRVDYALSPLGAELAERAQALIGWIRNNRRAIDASRAAFEDGAREGAC